MKQKRKAKKGVTLIEAIMSVALLAILIVPLSNVLLAAFQTNKNGEIKQKATIVGQKILEEMEAYDEIRLVNNDHFLLLDGDSVSKAGNQYTGVLNRDNFRVNVTMERDANFNYDSENANSGYALAYKLSQIGTQKSISQGSGTGNFANNLVLTIGGTGNANIFEENVTPSIISMQTANGPLDKGVSIELDSTFASDVNINVNVDSAVTGTTDIYIIKDKGCTGSVNVTSSTGNINVNRYMNLADLYNINVTVDTGEGTKILFQGSTKKNISFR